MKKYILVALLLVVYSCKKKEVAQKIDFVKLEEQVREVIPESVPVGKTALPRILSLNADEMQYFDMNQNKVFKINFKTNKKTLSHVPKGGGYLHFYKQTKNYRAISNGWEINSETKIKVDGEKELIYPQSVINYASNDKILFSEIKEGIDNENVTRVYDG